MHRIAASLKDRQFMWHLGMDLSETPLAYYVVIIFVVIFSEAPKFKSPFLFVFYGGKVQLVLAMKSKGEP